MTLSSTLHPSLQHRSGPADAPYTLPMSQAALEAIPFPLTIYACDGLYVGSNALVEQLFRVPKSAVVGFYNLLTDPATQSTEMPALFQAVLSGQRIQTPPMRYDYSFPGTQNSERSSCWIELTYFPFHNDAGTVTHVGAIIQDVTERVLAEQAQQQREAELRTFKALAKNASESLGITELSGRITYSNAAFGALTGYGDQLVGMNLAELYPDAGAELAVAMPQLFAEGRWSGQMLARRSDGSPWLAAISAFVLYDDAGQPGGLGAIIRDISAQQRAEEEREALRQQVISAQQAALRELSTPLIPITDEVVAMPLIGSIDSSRAQLVLETLLTGVAERRAGTTIIDITGVPVVDTQVANALIRAAQAVRLLGARVILTGIRPEVAQTLVNLGVDLSGIVTRGTLQSGIAEALGRTGEHATYGRR